MRQEKEALQCDQVSEMEIFELTDNETLCVAGGPEPDNDPHNPPAAENSTMGSEYPQIENNPPG